MVSCHVVSASKEMFRGNGERALEGSGSHYSDLDHRPRWICVMLWENEVVDARREVGGKMKVKRASSADVEKCYKERLVPTELK